MNLRHLLLAGVLLIVPSTGCKRVVPENIVRSSMEKGLRMAPRTASAMCGVNAMGLVNPKVTLKERGENNVGVVHVTGAPRGAVGGPAMCEGDVQYEFSYSTKTRRSGKRKTTTTTTWNLQRITLIAVQTPGVTGKPSGEEAPPDDDETAPE